MGRAGFAVRLNVKMRERRVKVDDEGFSALESGAAGSCCTVSISERQV